MIKDSGQRTDFGTGAVRDMHAGKGDMLSMPWPALLRVSKQYEAGADKYGRYNYQKGIPVSSFIDSAFRHIAKYVSGWDDEDHLSAAAFNILGAIFTEEVHPELVDIPYRAGKEMFHYIDLEEATVKREPSENGTPQLLPGNTSGSKSTPRAKDSQTKSSHTTTSTTSPTKREAHASGAWLSWPIGSDGSGELRTWTKAKRQ